MKDSLCFTFSQNLVTKVGFLPLSENEISSETEILHGVDDMFYPQHLHHQQKCCFSRGLLGRAVGVSYACRLFPRATRPTELLLHGRGVKSHASNQSAQFRQPDSRPQNTA